MKKTMILLLCICTLGAYAQPDREEPKRSEKVEALKRAYITSELVLTPVEAEKFWPVYNGHEETQKTHRKELKEILRGELVEYLLEEDLLFIENNN